jgi:transcriptional regulator with XRE-family HTH domain
MALADALRKKRTECGLSRNELARRAGVDNNYLWRIETGRSPRPSMQIIQRLADGLGCQTAELIGEQPAATPLTPAQKRWLGLLDMLPAARVPDAYAQVARLMAEDMEAAEDFPMGMTRAAS